MNMKRNKRIRIVMLLAMTALVLLVSGCPNLFGGSGDNSDTAQDSDEGDTTQDSDEGDTTENPDDAAQPGDVPQYFWGNWVRMDGVNEEWYISDSTVSIDNQSVNTDVIGATSLTVSGETVERKSQNMLTVAPGTNEYYLFRKSGATANVSAGVRGSGVTGSSLGALSVSGIAGINAVLRNLQNQSNQVESTTDSEGNADFGEIIPGDEYELEVPQQEGVDTSVRVRVKPEFDGDNVGFVTLTDAQQNFKVSYQLTGADQWGYAYVGESYDLTLRITNVGSADMLSANYEVTSPPEISMGGGNLQDILGTVQANGGVKELSYTISASAFGGDYQDYAIPIRITSVDGQNEWNDQITVRFYRAPMDIHVRSASNEVQGIVITPDNRSLSFSTSSRRGTIRVPERTAPYTLALSGADYDSETKYSLKLNAPPDSDGTSVTDSSIYEPNNDETERTPVYLNTEYGAYLGVYDLDFYEINNEIAAGQELTWTNIAPASGTTVADTTPTLSWDAMDGTGYEVQIADSEAAVSDATAVEVTEAKYTPSDALENNTTYYWRVRAVDADGQSTAWSATTSLTVSWGAMTGRA